MTAPSLYLLLADITLLLHFTYVLFVVVGQVVILIGWIKGFEWTRNPILRLVHLACIGIVVLQSWGGVVCPLTLLEVELRRMAGTSGAAYETTFIGDWVGRVLFFEAPLWVFTVCYSLFGLLVLATLILYPPRRRPSKNESKNE